MSPRKRNNQVASVSANTLTPLMEGPTPESYEEDAKKESSWNVMVGWVKGQLEKSTIPLLQNSKRSDVRLLLGVLGCPLAPIAISNEPLPHLSIKDVSIESSSAQYILHQYIAATGCRKFQNTVKSSYTMGRVKMVATECETVTKTTRNSLKTAEAGCFVLWQMMPDMWSVELVVAGHKMNAGCNGKIVWRHTPWLGSHAAKGPVRPLRRVLQGLDPRSIATMFSNARCVGEKRIGDDDCFILKLSASPSILAERSDGPAEIIKHVLLGYFSQKTGLLAYMEDSHLTRIQAAGADAVYWETTIESTIEDYKSVDDVKIAHSGRTMVTLFRFGEEPMSHTKTRMEESWTIDDVVFNVPGLCMDCFIPPADISAGESPSEKTTLLPK